MSRNFPLFVITKACLQAGAANFGDEHEKDNGGQFKSISEAKFML
jgi:hypothetical protein